MKTLRDFHPKILPYISGVPEPTLNAALVDAAIRFCEDTKVLRERTFPISTQNSQHGYELDSPSQHRISNVERVWCNGIRMTSLPNGMAPGNLEVTGTPRYFYGRLRDEVFEVALFPTPDGPYSISADVCYTPTRAATLLNDDLLERWIDAIRVGTLAYLHAIPGQPFSDLTLAASYGMSFIQKTNDARREMSFNRVSTSHTIKPRPIV